MNFVQLSRWLLWLKRFHSLPCVRQHSRHCLFVLLRSEDGTSFTVSRCIGCRVVHYCNKKCQKRDWINHKEECRFLKNCSPHVPSTICRLIARVVLKLERSDGQDVAFNGRRFEDIMDHRDDIQTDPKRMDEFATISLSLRNFMGEKHIPQRDVLMSIYGKVYTNSIGICGYPRPLAQGLFIGLSAQEHSCDPDAYFVFGGGKAILRSSRVKEYSMDVSVTYIELLNTNSACQRELRSKCYFTCTCSVCSDNTKDFLYNSVRSTCCPDSYCLLDPNATELSCFKCGKPSKITVDEAISTNKEVRIVLWDILKTHAANLRSSSLVLLQHTDSVYEANIETMIKLHEKFSKVLSHFNVNLLRVTDQLHSSAFQLRDHSVCSKHSANILLAYKRYLSPGNPVLSNRLMFLALEAASSEPTPTRKVLELLEETYGNATSTYDSRYPHSLTLKLVMELTRYRVALMNIVS